MFLQRFLDDVVADIEAHVAAAGWDRPPALFALVRADRFTDAQPDAAARLGIDAGDALTPIEQDELPEGPLDDVLAQIAWPDDVDGCALSQEIVLLPPDADAELDEDAGPQVAMAHPQRRDARLVVAVLRDGTSAAVLRLRTTVDDAASVDDLLTGPDLAPNLVAALHATLQ